MKRHTILYLLIGLAVVLALSSCTTYRKAVPVSPISTQVNLTYDDLEFLGEVTGTATQSTVVGIPYGGRKYHAGVLASQFSIPIKLNRGMNNALYDALMQKPDADFVLPIAVETTRVVLFLGSKTTYTVKAKAFKIKTK